MQEAATAERGCVMDALFVRHPEAARHQNAALVGLLFLLTPGTDPEAQAAVLTAQLGPLDALPPDGAVMPIWMDEADAWDCDAQAIAETRAQLDTAAALLFATVDDATGSQKVFCRQLPRDVAADARAGLVEALGEAMN